MCVLEDEIFNGTSCSSVSTVYVERFTVFAFTECSNGVVCLLETIEAAPVLRDMLGALSQQQQPAVSKLVSLICPHFTISISHGLM